MNDRKSTSETEKEPAWGWWMFGVGFGVLVLFAIIASIQYFVVKQFGANGVTKFGISGDFFGFLNALFSALAFAMIIVTLWMQKYELKQQRKELDQTQEIMKLQKKEMQNQRQEMQDQNESLRRQRFENTFFGMLELHNQVVSTMKVSNDSPLGRSGFPALLSSLYNFNPANKSAYQHTKPPSIDSVVRYEQWYPNYEAVVGHYFRTFYNIVRYVHESGERDRFTYARLVRAQLSSGELELLLYNGLSIYGKEKFKPLIEEYSLLKHLRKSDRNRETCKHYSPIAFGREAVDESP